MRVGLDGFRRWAEQWEQADEDARAKMIGEGRVLAEARREAMTSLIRQDPKRAIEEALPYKYRKALPVELASLIEHPVRGVGDFDLLASTTEQGQANPNPYRRFTEVNGRYYETFVYGDRERAITSANVRVLGIGVDALGGKGVLALRDSAYETLSAEEGADIRKEMANAGKDDPICSVSGDKAVSEEYSVVVATGADYQFFCDVGHVGQWASKDPSLAGMGGSGSSGGFSTVVPPTQAQGNKKVLVIRVRFQEQSPTYEQISDSDLKFQLQKSVDDIARWSYGRLHMSYAFTPTLLAPRPQAEYAASPSPERLLTSDMLEIAATLQEGGIKPYVSTDFDFWTVFFDATAFGNTYCGLATVGGPRAWIRCGLSMVVTHEWGHNFVLRHANQWEPTTESPIGPGIHREYGSRYSTMHGWFPFDRPGAPAFNTAERWTMGWLRTNEVTTVRSNGTHRIYNADVPAIVDGRSYGLRLPKDDRWYAVEFRPNFLPNGGNEFHTDNGVVVMWHHNSVQFSAGSGPGTQTLDMHPMTRGTGVPATEDSPLLIGRTFTDPATGMSLTPVAKGGTYPDDYIEVDVRFERSADNSAPSASLTASPMAAALNQVVQLAVTATDPDGDVLSYGWDFGDGTYSKDDLPSQSKAWTKTGNYPVRVEVSDRHGGRVIVQTIVRVGTPTLPMISGRVLSSEGVPLVGAMVNAGVGRIGYTGADGRYVLTQLPAGSHSLEASLTGWEITAVTSGPVVVPPTAVNVDFTAVPATPRGITVERWFDMPGTTVASLTGNPRYPNSPDLSFVQTEGTEPTPNVANNFGQRLRAWFLPTQTGPHTFYIASDDSSEFWLSTDSSPGKLVKIAFVNGATAYQEWTRAASQRSVPVNLVAGQRYYMQVLHKEGGGVDFVSIGVDLPDGTSQKPMDVSMVEPMPAPGIPVPSVAVSVEATDAQASETGDAGLLTFTRTGSTAAALTVFYVVSGTATAGVDYVSPGLQVTIPAGSASATVAIQPLTDFLKESLETVQVNVAPTVHYRAGASAEAVVQLADDGPIEISVVASDPSADESGVNPGAFTFSRGGSVTSATTVNYTVGGTATSGVDYRALTGTVEIPAGVDSVTVPLTPVGDDSVEVAETVVVTVGAGSYAIATPSSATVTIDLDRGPGRGLLREWYDGLAVGTLDSLLNDVRYPFNPTGHEIVTTSFQSGSNRADRFGERWRAIFTAASAGQYRFYIGADDVAELWLSKDPSGAGAERIAWVSKAVPAGRWDSGPYQASAGIQLEKGQRVYLEARWVENLGGDYLAVGVQHPNGLLERPIPAHRLDPYTPSVTPPAPWASLSVGGGTPTGSSGIADLPVPVQPLHRWSMDGTAGGAAPAGTLLSDSIGGMTAVIRGAGARFTADGKGVDLPGGDPLAAAYIDLPNGVVSGASRGAKNRAVTLEGWFTMQTLPSDASDLIAAGSAVEGEIEDVGVESLFFLESIILQASDWAPFNEAQVLTRLDVERTGTFEMSVTTAPLPIGERVHIVMVYDPDAARWAYYRNGVELTSIPDPVGPGDLNDVNVWLGRCTQDYLRNVDGIFHEFRIYDQALTPAQIRGNMMAGPEQVGLQGLGTFSLLGSGAVSPDAETDRFHFLAQSVAGSSDFRARVQLLAGGDPLGTAGLMIRATDGADSPHASISISPDGTARFTARIDAGGNATTVTRSGFTGSLWLRLVRGGDSVQGYVSADGTAWTSLGSATGLLRSDSVGEEAPVLAGFTADGPTANAGAYAIFSNVSLTRSPQMATYAPRAIGTRTATLRGTVTPNGSPMKAFFEYGLTTAYGMRSETNDVGNGLKPVEVNLPVSGLAPHTVHHVRLVVEGPNGLATGEDVEFTTLNSTPVAVNDVPAPLTSSGLVTISVLLNDTDADGDALRIQSVSQAAHGVVAIASGSTRVTYNPADSYVGPDSFTYTVTDGAGGTAVGTVQVQVPDTQAPVITGSFTPLALRTGPSGTVTLPNYLAQATLADNVGVVASSQTPVAGTPLGVGPVVVRLRAADAADHVTEREVNALVEDGTVPVITSCPAGRTLGTGSAALPDLTGELVATDNIAITSRTQSPAAGTVLQAGTHSVLLTVRDAAGNEATCTLSVTVNPIIQPVIAFCRTNIVLDADALCRALMPDVKGAEYIVATGEGGPFVLTQSLAVGTVLQLGTAYTNVTTVTGGAGGVANCTNVIVLRDVLAPAIAGCPADQTVQVAAGANSAVPDFVTGWVATDCNGPVQKTQSPAAGTLVGIGAHVVTLTAMDAAGNTSQCTVGFVVEELVVAAPEIAVVGNSAGIADGDGSPDSADHTDFGSTLVAGGTVARTFTIQNTGNAALNVASIGVTGTHAAEFAVSGVTLPAVVAPSGTLTFVVTFDPAGGGLRAAAVTIVNDDPDEASFDFAVRGVGIEAAGVAVLAATDAVGPLATLNGTVNARDLSTTVTFEYGTTTDYGTTVAAVPGTVTGSQPTAVSVGLSGLVPGQLYHFRIVAVNANGTTRSDDATFATTVPPPNQNPTIAAAAGSVTVNEGAVASNSGTFADADNEAVTLSATLGTVTTGAGGTWTWSYATTDGPDNGATVRITATDVRGGQGQVEFALAVNNTVPVLLAGGASVTVNEGQLAAMNGTWTDAGADTVVLTASAGTVVKNANGTWSWSLATTDGPDNSQTVTITGTDSDGGVGTTTFALVVNDLAPVLTNGGNKIVNSGAVASNTGTWTDLAADTVALTASIGTVTQDPNGTWSWSVDTTGLPSQQVTITGTDSDGVAGTTSFNLTVESPIGATFVWNAAANGAGWSAPSSWTITSGADADGIPDANDDVVFNGTRTTASTVGASFVIRSLQVQAGYTGLITLGGNTLNVSGGLTVASAAQLQAFTGTIRFSGSQTVNVPVTLGTVVVDAGAVVSLESDLVVSFNGTLAGAGVIRNAGGLLVVGRNNNQPYNFNFSGSIDDLVLDSGDNGDISIHQNVNVKNTLLITRVRNLFGNQIRVGGTVTSDDGGVFGNTYISMVGEGDQTLTGTGMLLNLFISKPSGDVLLPSDFFVDFNGTLAGTGRIRNTGGRVIVGRNGNQPYNFNFAGSIDDLVLDSGDGGDLSFHQALSVNNTLLISHVRNLFGTQIKVGGKVTSNDGGVFGNTFISMVGAGDQTLTGAGMLLNLNIAKPSGDVLLPSDFYLDFNGTLAGSGRIRNEGGRLIICRNNNQAYNFNFAGTVDDLVLDSGDGGDISFHQALNVGNTLLISNVRNLFGTQIRVGGKVTSNDGGVFGNTTVSMVGVGDQTLTGSGMLLNLNIAKPSGDVLLPADFYLDFNGTLAGTGRIRNTGGRLVIGRNSNQAYNFVFSGTVDDLVLDPGDNGDLSFHQALKVGNTLLISHVRNLFGTQIQVGGTVTSVDGGVFGNTTVSMVGAGDQTLTGGGMLLNLNIAKPSGDVLLPADFYLDFNGTLAGTGRIRNTGGRLVIGRNGNQAYNFVFSGTVDDLVLDSGDNGDLSFHQPLKVGNTLLISRVRNLFGTQIQVAGTVTSTDGGVFGNTTVSMVGSGDQTLTGGGMVLNLNIAKPSGDVLLPSDFYLDFNGTLAGAGRIRNTGGRLVIGRNFNQAYNFVFSGSIDDLVLDPGDSGDLAFHQNLTVNNTLLFSHVRNLNGGVQLRVAGDVRSDDGSVTGGTTVSLVGSTDQTLTGTGNLVNLHVAKSGGDVLLPTNFVLDFNGTLSGTGRFRSTGGALVIGRGFNQAYNFLFGGTIDDLILDPGDNGDLAFHQSLSVTKNLTITRVRFMNGAGWLRAAGTVTCTDPGVFGSTPLSLVGEGDQTLTGGGGLTHLNVFKPSGDVLLPTNFVLSWNGGLSGSGRIRSTGGTLIIGYGDNQPYTADFSGTVDRLELNLGDSGDLSLVSDLSVGTSLKVSRIRFLHGPGWIRAVGDVTSDDPGIFGASYISLVGSGDQQLLGTGRLGNLDIAKPSGDVLMSTFDRNFSQVLVSAGQWNVLGNTVTSANGFLVRGGAVTGTGTLTGPVTVNAGAVLDPGLATAGILNTGNLVLAAESELQVRVAGAATAGADYDQVNVVGTVNVSNARLNLIGAPADPADTTPIVLINNDGADGIAGTFADLPQNALVTLNGTDYRISYNGGTGNDVTLTSVNSGTPTLSAVLAGGDLTVTDTSAGGEPNRVSVRLVGGNVVISDVAERFVAPAPAGGVLSENDRTLTLPAASISGRLIVNLGGGADVFVVDASAGSLPFAIEYNGGGSAVDRLEVGGTTWATAAINHTSATGGQLVLDPVGSDPARTLTFSGVEKLDLSRGAAESLSLQSPAVASGVLIEEDNGFGNGVVRWRSSNNTFPTTDVPSPSLALAILPGHAGDTLTVGDLAEVKSAVSFGSDVARFGSINVGGRVRPATGRNFAAYSTGTLQFSSSAADVATTGAGSILLVSSRDVVLTPGSSLTTQDGALTIEANQQSPATAANFSAIFLNGAGVHVLGNGTMTLRGTPGSVGGSLAITVAGGAFLTVANGPMQFVGDSVNLVSQTIRGFGSSVIRFAPRTPGVAINLGGADGAGVLGLTDAELDSIVAPKLEMGDASSGPLTISAAMSRPIGSDLRLRGGGVAWTAAGSLELFGGNLTVDARGGVVGWQQAGTAINAASVTFTAGDFLRPSLTSATTMRSLVVGGEVRLAGVRLDVDNGGFNPVIGTVFPVVLNDATEAVAGTFQGLGEGAVATVGGGQFSVSYVGGTGNDVTLGAQAPQPEIAVSQAIGGELVDGQGAAVNFGLTTVGTPVVRDFLVSNQGSLALNISSITAPPGFSVLFAPATVAPGTTAGFQIRFNATSAGVYSNAVVILSNDGNEAEFNFPVYARANTLPTLAVDLPTVSVNEGATAVNSGRFEDLDGDAVTLSASIGTIASLGVVGEVDLTTAGAWRTPSVAKALDADGDNIYGTDGYVMWGLGMAENRKDPSYATITRVPTHNIQIGFFTYTALDNPANPTGPKLFVGGLWNSPGANPTTFFSLAFTEARHVRIGLLVDCADYAGLSPRSLRVRQTVGGTFDTGFRQAGTPATRNRSGDWYFFDIEGEAGDVFEISGENDTSIFENALGGVVLDTITGGGSGGGAWGWSLPTTDGPAQSQVVTITANDGVNPPLVRTFQLNVANVAPAATFAVAPASTGLYSDSVVASFSGATDASTADSAAGFRYSYDFDGNGTWDQGDGTYAGGVNEASVNVPAHFLSAAGLRTVRARITDKDGGSADRNATVDIVAPPIVTTQSPTTVGTRTATLAALVDAQTQATTLTFRYGTRADLVGGVDTLPVAAGSGVGMVARTVAVSGLLPHTQYYVRATASNADGAVVGDVVSFTTGNTPPVVVADDITLASAGVTTLAVLGNDLDADGDVLAVTSVQQTVNATVSLAPGGAGILYDPVDAFVGTEVLVYTVNDGFGGTASGQVTVRVPDTMAPVFSACAPAQTVDANAGGTGVIPALTGLATATDNVAVVSLTQSPTAGSVVGIGAHTVTLSARDAAGNVGTCVVTVTVRDVTAPVLTAKTPVDVALEWAVRHSSTGDRTDSAERMAVDKDGNVYVVGSGPGPSGNTDILLVKYTTNGQLLWSQYFNGIDNRADQATALAIGSNGTVVVAGRSMNAAGDDDAVVIRFDPVTGAPMWSSVFNGDGRGTDAAVDVAVDGTGNVLVVATSKGAGNNKTDVVTRKLEGGTGATVWRHGWDGGSTEDAAVGLALDASGNVLVSGWTARTSIDLVTFKLGNVKGELLWAALYDAPAGLADTALDITAGADGDAVVAVATQVAGGTTDYAVLRFRGSDGARLWASRYNGPGNYVDVPQGVLVGAAGDVFVTGYSDDLLRSAEVATLGLRKDSGAIAWSNRHGAGTNGVAIGFSLAFDVDGRLLVAGSAENAAGGVDFVVQKIDPATGATEWIHLLPNPGTGDAMPRSIAVDRQGSILVAGRSVVAGTGMDFLTYKLAQPGSTDVAPQSAIAGAGCQAPVPDLAALLTITDANGPVSVVQVPAAGTMVGAGLWPVTLTATDAAGNSTSTTTTFSVLDGVAPTFASVPPDIEVCSTNGVNAVVTFVLPTATDDCSTALVTADRLSGSTFPAGLTVVTVTAADAAGNRATTTFRVRVNRAPTAAPYSLTTDRNVAVTVTASKILGTVTDADGDVVTIVGVDTKSEQGGTVAYDGTKIVYTPPTGYKGGDSFVVRLSDGHCAVLSDKIAVTVTAPVGNLVGAEFHNAGEGLEIYRSRRFGGRDIYFSDDDGVTWTFLGRVYATGVRTFIIRYGTPKTGYYRFDPAP